MLLDCANALQTVVESAVLVLVKNVSGHVTCDSHVTSVKEYIINSAKFRKIDEMSGRD